ncbi:MAG: hypothetical protein V1914_00645, partial [archaeon]
ATTPLANSVWDAMGNMGNRLFFLQLKEKNRVEEDYIKMFEGEDYEEKVKECRGAVKSFLDSFFLKYQIRSLRWNKSKDREILKKIIKYSQLLSRLRASMVPYEEKQSGEIRIPLVEEPPRIINAFLNFARGHALINGREHLTEEDLEFVRAVCFSSMPLDRQKFLNLLIKYKGRMTTEQIEKELNCHNTTATRTMNLFETLGLVKIKGFYNEDGRGYGNPMNYVEVMPEFEEILFGIQV